MQQVTMDDNVELIKFDIGYFDLVTKREQKDGQKLPDTWKSPIRIKSPISDLVHEFWDLASYTYAIFYASRLKLLSESSLEVTDELQDTIPNNDTSLDMVEVLFSVCFNRNTEYMK